MKSSIIIYQRKPRLDGNYSLEGITAALLPYLKNHLNIEVRTAPHESSGILPRIAIMLDARRRRCGLLHIAGDINFAGLLRPKKSVAITIHDCGFLNGPRNISWYVKKLLWLYLPVVRSAAIFCVSDFTRQEIIRYLGRDPGNLHVVDNPLSPHFSTSPHKFNTHKPRILQIGTTPNKNISRLAEALSTIPCKLIVVGPLRAEDRAQLQKHGVDFECLSRLSDSEILDQYRQADIVTFCSTFEGFGLPIIEGQAMGRVVLTSSLEPMLSVAGQNGAQFVDPLDVASIREGFRKLISSEKTREELIAAGATNVKRFSAQTIADAYVKLYNDLLDSEH